MNKQGTASQRPTAWVLDNIAVDVIYEASLQAEVGADLGVGLHMICQRSVLPRLAKGARRDGK